MTKEKIFSVFALGILVGIILTSLTKNVRTVDAIRRPIPTRVPTAVPTVVVTPTPTVIQNKVAGFYQDLTGAMLNGTFLAYHDFKGFTLTNASLRDANLSSSVFDGANLDGADFTNSNLKNMSHVGASFVGTKWYSCPEGDGACGSTFCPNGDEINTNDATCF